MKKSTCRESSPELFYNYKIIPVPIWMMGLVIFILCHSGAWSADANGFDKLREAYPWYLDWDNDAYLFQAYPRYMAAKLENLNMIAEKYEYDKKGLKSFTEIGYDLYYRKAGIYRPTGIKYTGTSSSTGQSVLQEYVVDQSIESVAVNFNLGQTFVLENRWTFSTLIMGGKGLIKGDNANNTYFSALPMFGVVTSHGGEYDYGQAYFLRRDERFLESDVDHVTLSSTSSSLNADGSKTVTTSYRNAIRLKDAKLHSGYATVTLLELGPRITTGNQYSTRSDKRIDGVDTYEKPPWEIALRWRHIYWSTGLINGSRFLEVSYQPANNLLSFYGEINHLFVLGLGYTFSLGGNKVNDPNYPEGSIFTRALSVRLGLSAAF